MSKGSLIILGSMSTYPLITCAALVPFGTNLGSTVGYGRFSRIVGSMICLPPYQISVIIGILLSDAWLQRGKANWNARLGFKQGIVI
jgi:hypothetical protein